MIITTILVYVCLYLAAAVFVVACAVRAVYFARMPLHLRWELYPVPHEEAARVRHGGSYFETSNWWEKPLRFNWIGEWKAMLPEMLFQKALWEFNRSLWFLSFPFHFGLYLLTGAAGLLAGRAVVMLWAPGLLAGEIGMVLHYANLAVFAAGAALAMLGALSLLARRLTDPNLQTYTTPGDLFNLLFFLATLGCLVGGLWDRPAGAPPALALARSILTFDAGLHLPALLATGLVLSALLTAYIPMTHMSHFIAKYFTYHTVRWDDRPNLKGSDLARRMADYLTYRPRWAAPHVGADGVKTWAEIATANPAQGGRK
jgi:nitrate reductase gamma subunit